MKYCPICGNTLRKDRGEQWFMCDECKHEVSVVLDSASYLRPPTRSPTIPEQMGRVLQTLILDQEEKAKRRVNFSTQLKMANGDLSFPVIGEIQYLAGQVHSLGFAIELLRRIV